MKPTGRRRILQVVAVAVLLAAVAPNVIYAGHWASMALSPDAMEAAVADHDHSGHNHGVVSGVSAPWWINEQTLASLDSEQQRVKILPNNDFWTEPTLPHQSPPPRFV